MKPGLYETVLAGLAGAESPWAERPPRPSVGIVPWREGPHGLEVFWIQRAPTMAFMGGWYAFPGGGVARHDAGVVVHGSPTGVEGAPREAALPAAVVDGVEPLPEILQPGVAAAAVRELFEETGRLLGGESIDPDALGASRHELLRKELSFDELLARYEVAPDVSSLVYGGRWLTPALGPMRFDNRFFLLEWPEGDPCQPNVAMGEIARGEWIRPVEAVARWRSGRLLTAPPILHILQVLAENGPHDGLDRLRAPAEANLGPHRMVEFSPGVLLFPLRTPTLPPATTTNAFLLGFGDCILVDPGSPDEREIGWLVDALRAAESQLGRTVREIWLTHHHPDHVGGVEAARSALEVPVRAHEETGRLLQAVGVAIDGTLAEGDSVELPGDPALKVDVLHTPGHAPGHLCFHETVTNALLGGDLVSGISTIVIDPPLGEMGSYLESLRRVRDLEVAVLHPAHGPTVRFPSRELESTLQHRQQREEAILEAFQDGRHALGAIVETVYDDVPSPARPLAERQALAHLQHLAAQGRVELPSELSGGLGS